MIQIRPDTLHVNERTRSGNYVILIHLFLSFLLVQKSLGQKISIDTLLIPRREKFSNQQNDKLKFPIIRTGSLITDKKINRDLKNRFTNHEYPDLSTKTTLYKWSEGIIYLDFEVTYIKNGIISFNISAEGCGAYCTSWTEYYNYNTETGQYVTIDQILDTSSMFKMDVVIKRNEQFEIQKKELRDQLQDKSAELDEETYQWAMHEYENCQGEFTWGAFALYPDHLQIINECPFPHMIQNLTPSIDLNYSYAAIKKYLKLNL